MFFFFFFFDEDNNRTEVTLDSSQYDSPSDFCVASYNSSYQSNYSQKVAEIGGSPSEAQMDEFEKYAQKEAIRTAITQSIQAFPEVSINDLWAAIHSIHLIRKSRITDFNVIRAVVSAEQSWKASSGHAFEEMIKNTANIALANTPIEIVLQRDLTTMLKEGSLGNEPRDIEWLQEQVDSDVFDLYSLVHSKDKVECFGCIQAKTTIRDRVSRDREPSSLAMEHFFWSVTVLLNDTALRGKYIDMVNGNSAHFPTNGWHGLYAFSATEQNDRIYPISLDMEIFKQHALKAANHWKTQRQWFNGNWRADE